MKRFHKIGGRVVFGAEPFCWPDKSLASKYPPSTGKKYLNSGGEISLKIEVNLGLFYIKNPFVNIKLRIK